MMNRLTIINPDEEGGAWVRKDGHDIGSVRCILDHPDDFIGPASALLPVAFTQGDYDTLERAWNQPHGLQKLAARGE